MKHDLYLNFECLSQRQIGEFFNATSHEVGRWLKEIGLRDRSGQPTARAIDEGLAMPVIPEVGKLFFGWNKEKVVTLLAKDHHLVGTVASQATAVSTMTLIGPFAFNQSSEDGFEVRGADGVVSIWVRGEASADVIVRTLNFVNKHQRLGKL